MAAFDLGAMIGTAKTTANNAEVRQIPCDMLIPYHNHKFELYTGERLNDMIESVRKNGVLIPIVVQPSEAGKYEILIGHNRWNASKLAEKSSVPAIIKTGLSDEEAEMYVTESNLMQRGFSELKISEQAAVIAKRYEDAFDSEKLVKIREELQDLETGCENEDVSENTVYKRFNDDKKEPKIVTVGRLYGLSKNSVARLLRINTLTDELKKSVDMNTLPLTAGVELSYIPKTMQKAIFSHYKQAFVQNNIWTDAAAISQKDAKKLRMLFEDFTGDEKQAETALNTAEKCGDKAPAQPKPKKIRYEIYSKYFDESETEDNINDIVDKALAMYFEHLDKEEE